jgi:hypothetical protein
MSYKTRNAPSFIPELAGGFIEPRLKVRPAMLPSHIDGLFR